MKKRLKFNEDSSNKINALNKWIRSLKQGELQNDENNRYNLKKTFKNRVKDDYLIEFNNKKQIIESNLKNLEKEIKDKKKDGLLLDVPKFKIKNRFVMRNDQQRK
jgi:hypothetical protein